MTTPLDVLMGADQAARTPQFARGALRRLFNKDHAIKKSGSLSESPQEEAIFANHVREVFGVLYGASTLLEESSAPDWAKEELRELAESPQVKRLNEVGMYDPEVVADLAVRILTARQFKLALEAKERGEKREVEAFDQLQKSLGPGQTIDGLFDEHQKELEEFFEEAIARASDSAAHRTQWGLGPALTDADAVEVPRFPKEALSKIAELAGRASQVAYASRARVRAPGTPTSLERGRSVERYVPTELALFADPLTKEIGTERWLQRSALQFQQAADDRSGRGPIIIAIDVSGSMIQPLDGVPRELWARGVALALAEIAHQQNRPVRIMCYENGVVLDETPRKKSQIREVVSRKVKQGGTQLLSVYQALRSLSGPWVTADLVVISDGEDYSEWQPEAFALRKNRGVRTHAIGIQEMWPEKSMKSVSTFVLVKNGDIDLTQIYQAI